MVNAAALVLLPLLLANAAIAKPSYKFLPKPGTSEGRRLFDDNNTPGVVRRLYLQNLIANTPPDILKATLRKLATPAVLKRIQVNPEYLLENPVEIVPYFTNQEFDETMALVSQELRNRKLDLTNLSPKQQKELDKAFETYAVAAWLSQKFGARTSNGKEKFLQQAPSPPPKLTPAQQKLYGGPFPKPTTGNGTIKISSRPLTLEQQIAAVQHFNPKSNKTEPQKYGRLDGFTPVQIPVVFHLMGYVEKGGEYFPPYNWWARGAVKRLVGRLNNFYKNTGFSFRVAEVRWDPRKYSYLNTGNLLDWQNITPPLVRALSARHRARNYALNVWVAGSFEGAFKCTPLATVCMHQPSAVSSPGPGGDPRWLPGQEDDPYNFVYLNYDRFSPDAFNNAQSYHGGSVSLAHEVGHYFGLLHTHQGGCKGPGDAVGDTIPSKEPGEHFDAEWYVELSGWCKAFRAGKQPKSAPLKKMHTCSAAAPDNLFNLMSYMDDPCRMGLTENQVARMQWAVKTYRPKMMKAHAVSKSKAATSFGYAG